jgi:hypothetical protein
LPRGQLQPFFLHIVAPEEEKIVRRTFGCVNIRVACHVVSGNHFFYTLLLLKKKSLLGGRLVV